MRLGTDDSSWDRGADTFALDGHTLALHDLFETRLFDRIERVDEKFGIRSVTRVQQLDNIAHVLEFVNLLNLSLEQLQHQTHLANIIYLP
jgi:hypothetical protein